MVGEKFPVSGQEVTVCIDRGLERVGQNVKYLVYWHLQKIGQVTRTDMVADPDSFVSALRGLYRESAAAVEKAIVQELNVSFDLNYPPTQLAKAIKEARQKVLQLKAV